MDEFNGSTDDMLPWENDDEPTVAGPGRRGAPRPPAGPGPGGPTPNAGPLFGGPTVPVRPATGNAARSLPVMSTGSAGLAGSARPGPGGPGSAGPEPTGARTAGAGAGARTTGADARTAGTGSGARATGTGSGARATGTGSGARATGRRRAALIAGAVAGAALLVAGVVYAATRDGTPPAPGTAFPVSTSPPESGQQVPVPQSTVSTALPVPPPGTEAAPTTVSPGPAAPTTATPATEAPVAPRCHTTDLRLIWGPTNGAAGTVYASLGFINGADHPCRMYGFPGMEPVDASGNQIPVTVVRTGEQPALITLANGQTAWAAIHWAQAPGSYTGPACTGAAGLVVTPPDETTQLRLSGEMHVCGDGTITTGPVVDRLPAAG